MRIRFKRPLIPHAVLAAFDDLYHKHPELTENGIRRVLDITDAADAPYRRYWHNRYLQHGGEPEKTTPESIYEQNTEVETDVQICSDPYQKIPIIFLPGIMGSRLYFPSSGKFWDPDDLIGMFIDWIVPDHETRRADLHFSRDAEVMTARVVYEGTAVPPYIEEDRGAGWLGVTATHYGLMLEELQARTHAPRGTSCPVYAVGYDFRQSNAASGLVVARRIRTILAETGADKFILITHSMGGIVARSTLQNSDDLQKKTLAVLHLMQPAHGSPNFYRYCVDGADNELGVIFGNEAHEFLTVASGQRGAFELLPTNDYCRPEDDKSRGIKWIHWSYDDDSPMVTVGVWLGNIYNLYRSTNSRSPGLLYLAGLIDESPNRKQYDMVSISGEVADRLNEAEKFHRTLGTYSLIPVTWHIYSSNHTTCVGIRMDIKTPNAVYREHLPYRIRYHHGIEPEMIKAGDDTVPVSSSDGRVLTNDDNRRKEVVTDPRHGHSRGCSDPAMIEVVLGVLEGILFSS